MEVEVDHQDPEQHPAPGNASYVAVVHVHGMGNQRRLEELGHLVDSLDQ